MSIPFFKPKDIIALVVLVSILWLKAKGLDGQMDTITGLILGYYFVKRESGQDKGV